MTISRSMRAPALHLAAFLLMAAAAGPVLAQSRFKPSADGSEVTDTQTQLTWKRCAEGTQWDGKACTGKAMRFDFRAAKKHAAVAGKGAAWRLPSRDELVGLVDKAKKKKPKIDVDAFPNTPSLPFWATRAGSTDDLNAWLVNFSNGKVLGNVAERKFPVRLVRAAS